MTVSNKIDLEGLQELLEELKINNGCNERIIFQIKSICELRKVKETTRPLFQRHPFRNEDKVRVINAKNQIMSLAQ